MAHHKAPQTRPAAHEAWVRPPEPLRMEPAAEPERADNPMNEPQSANRTGAVDTLAYLGVWPAAVAATLIGTNALMLGLGPGDRGIAQLIAFGFCGCLVVYDLDRLRDLERDRATAPRRARFVEAHRGTLRGLIAAAALTCGLLALQLGVVVWGISAGALALGLLHRRMKAHRKARVLYVTGAWLAVVVRLPTLAGVGASESTVAISAQTLAALCISNASAIASNLVCTGIAGHADGRVADTEQRRLRAAQRIAVAGVVATLVAGPAHWPLALLPGSQAIAALGFRSDERYRHALLDVSLLAGAGLAGLAIAWAPNT
jgi:4-hydroxybenzoate polyprenyltransferase